MSKKYIFVHSEWTDTCTLDTTNKKIYRELYNNEKGKYYLNNSIIIINWENWEGDDIFIKKNNYYYHQVFYNKYINNFNLLQINFIHSEWNKICIMNNELKIIFKIDNLKEFGNYYYKDQFLIINWVNWGEEKFIKILDNYYSEKYIINIINNEISNNEILNNEESNNEESNNEESNNEELNNEELNNEESNSEVSNNELIKNKNIQKFKMINKKFYYNNNIEKDNNINNEFNNLTHKYDILKFNLNINIIKDNLNIILNNNILNNKNYLNTNNIQSFINNNIDNNLLNDIQFLNINFEIPEKKNKRCLSLVEWGYPPFGGGENWILNFNKLLYNNNYDNYLICFSDPFKNHYFDKINFIDLKYIKIIQSPKDLLTIIKFIKLIDPDLINHQGVNRLFFMKLSNLLEIPFLTGFCFWQNILKFNSDNINVNMLNNPNIEKTDEFEYILNNSYSYVSSNFVNDIIYKLYNTNLDVIETISLDEDYIINSNINKKLYVTLINCHNNKGGYLIKYLCENLDYNIPLKFVYTENDPVISIEYIENIIKKRNHINNINLLIPNKVDIKDVYNDTRIILIPSLCEETFCRVGYEAMMNNIPILSTKNGNLKYLLKDYAIFIEDFDFSVWKDNIENIYYNKEEIINFSKKQKNDLSAKIIEDKIINKLNTITGSKYKLIDNNIGIIIPWADQGLGIQCRDYYITLKNIGYTPYILSFKPYHATHDNIYLQSNKEEWDYENITYSSNYREDLTYDEVLEFIYKNKIKKIFIVEATFINIFNIIAFLKLLNIKIYLIVNIECIRLVELDYHNIFDKILTNNIDSQIIMSNLFKDKSRLLGFHLNHPYFDSINKVKKNNYDIIKFCCIGGLNSLTRKNINLIISTFYNIFYENQYLNWELDVYIQGVEIPEIVYQCSCDKINYYINNLSYKEVLNCYVNSDIFIHMGSHEGLGLGFFESIYCGTPILTMNWTPNNEIISNYINGWLINCNYEILYDNDNSLINRGTIEENHLKDKIIEIVTDLDNTTNIINNTIDNKDNIRNKNKILFERNFKSILK